MRIYKEKISRIDHFSHWAFSISLFVMLIVAHHFLREDVIYSSMLIRDDIQQYPKSLFSPYKNNLFYWDVFTYINQSAGSLSNVRLFYTLLLAICGTLFYFVGFYFIKSKGVAFLLSIATFTSPHTLIFISFINGSYQVLFLLAFLLSLLTALLATARYACLRNKIYLYLVGALILFLVWLQLEFSSGSMLLPLVLIGVLVINRPTTKPHWDYIKFSTILSVGVLLLIANRYIDMNAQHPYSTSISDRISYLPSDVVVSSTLFLLKIPALFFEKSVNFTYIKDLSRFLSFEILIVIAIYIGLLIFTIIRSLSKPLVIPYIIFLLSGAILSAVAYGAVTVHHPWYYFPPFVFLMLLLLFCIDLFDRRISYLTASLLCAVSLHSFKDLHEPFSESAKDQDRFKEFLVANSSNWEGDSSIYIKVDRLPYMFDTRGVDIRAKSYVGFTVNRQDLKTVIIDTQLELPSSVLGSPSYFYDYSFEQGEGFEFDRILKFDEPSDSYVVVSRDGVIVDRLQNGSGLNTPSASFEYFTSQPDFLSGHVFRVGARPKRTVSDAVVFDDNKVPGVIQLSGVKRLGLKIAMKSNEAISVGPYSQDYPPMPFRSDILDALQLDENRMRFIINPRGDKVRVDISGDFSSWNTFNFIFTDDKCLIFKNWSLVREVKLDFLDLSSLRSIKFTVGSGYRNRFWSGEIDAFEISAFDANDDRLLVVDHTQFFKVDVQGAEVTQ